MRQSDLTLCIAPATWLHTCHPYNKLAYVLLAGVAVYCLPGRWMPGAFFLGLNLLVGGLGGVLPNILNFSWRVLLPLALFMFPIHGFLYPANHTPLWSYHSFVVYQEGLLFAAKILMQLAAVLTASLLFVFTTEPADFITALVQTGWPPFAAYLVGGPLLMLPAMRERIRVIQAAQRSRGLDSEGSLMKRIRSVGPLVTPLVIGAFTEIEQRAIALEARGFNLPGRRTSLREVSDSKLQKTLRWLMLCVSVIIFATAIVFWI